MRKLALTIAAVALAAGGASAQPGGNDGPGNENDKSRSEKSSRSSDASAKPNNAAANKPSKPSKADGLRSDKGPTAQREASRTAPARSDRGPPMANGRDAAVKRAKDGRLFHDELGWSPRITIAGYRLEPISGCPPGLAKKNNGCTPPGLAKNRQHTFGYPFGQPDWWGYSQFSGGRYHYQDGYLMRLGRAGNVDAFIPLLGGALSVGNRWPDYYEPASLSPYYADYYGAGPSSDYRYADRVVYQVDPETAAINSIVALLTGDEFIVGQPVPAGYDVYNVPNAYRDQYADRPDSRYRYSDGYVYEIDPRTRLVVSAIQLLT